MRALLLAAALLAVGTTSAQAAGTCSPGDFRFRSDTNGWSITGTLEVPTPGYQGRLSRDPARGPNAWVYTLTAPRRSALQVVTPLPIQMTGAYRKARPGPITVRIQKPFSWGPDTISCTPARR